MDLKSSFKPFPEKFFRIYYSTHVSLPCIQFFLREKPQIDIKKIKIFIDFTFDHFSYSISNVFVFFAEPASGVFRACRSSKCRSLTRAVHFKNECTDNKFACKIVLDFYYLMLLSLLWVLCCVVNDK